VAALDQEHAERVDGGGFADAGRAGDADADRLAGVGQQRLHQLARRGLMIGAPASISVIARASAARWPARSRKVVCGGKLRQRNDVIECKRLDAKIEHVKSCHDAMEVFNCQLFGADMRAERIADFDRPMARNVNRQVGQGVVDVACDRVSAFPDEPLDHQGGIENDQRWPSLILALISSRVSFTLNVSAISRISCSALRRRATCCGV
jgi:hypothetical protein